MYATVIQKIKRLEQIADNSYLYRKKLIEFLREVVPFDAACCTMVDPNTLLSIGSVFEEGVEKLHQLIFKYEYNRPDFNSYEEIIASSTHVRVLSLSTEGMLMRSARYRDVLQPAGIGDELRAALCYEQACWGYLTLFRTANKPFFHKQDCELIEALAPLIARVLRTFALRLPDQPAKQYHERGILLVTEQMERVSSNVAAEYWLNQLRRIEEIDDDQWPCTVQAVCARALNPMTEKRAHVCISVQDQGYLAVRASCLQDTAGLNQLAVSLEPANSSEFIPIVTEAYELSAREKQITALIFRGLSTKEIAAELNISSYTVQDHIKSIFTKTGATNRRELMWRIWSGHR